MTKHNRDTNHLSRFVTGRHYALIGISGATPEQGVARCFSGIFTNLLSIFPSNILAAAEDRTSRRSFALQETGEQHGQLVEDRKRSQRTT